MADEKNYYYIRLKDNFFDTEAVQILEAMPDGYLYCNILLKLYLKSLKYDGCLMYNERIPYNATVLATLTRHNVGTIEKALQVFKDLDLVEILDNGAIYMLDIQNYIGKSSTEADRKREYRNRIEQEKALLLEQAIGQNDEQMSGQMSEQMSGQNSPEIRDKSIDIIDKENKERKKKKVSKNSFDSIISAYAKEDDEILDLLGEWLKVRKAKRSAMTDRAIQMNIDKLDKLAADSRMSVKEYLKEVICRGWAAFYVINNYDNKASSGRKEPIPKWMPNEQNNYDFDELENTLTSNLGNNPELRQRADELRQRLAQ